MENAEALGAIILMVLAVIHVERVQRGTAVVVYGKKRVGGTPEKDPRKPAGRRRLAPLLSLLLPGTGRLYRGAGVQGTRHASIGLFCRFSIGISLVKGIEAPGLIFAAPLLMPTLGSTIQAGCRSCPSARIRLSPPPGHGRGYANRSL